VGRCHFGFRSGLPPKNLYSRAPASTTRPKIILTVTMLTAGVPLVYAQHQRYLRRFRMGIDIGPHARYPPLPRPVAANQILDPTVAISTTTSTAVSHGAIVYTPLSCSLIAVSSGST
jgi:hypothetical protein